MNIEYGPLERMVFADELHCRLKGQKGDVTVYACSKTDSMFWEALVDKEGWLKWQEESLREAVAVHLDEIHA